MQELAKPCSDFPTGWPGIAVPPGLAHSSRGVIFESKVKPLECQKHTYAKYSADSAIFV